MSRIAYLSKSTIPSRTANSVHVMKMCQALANENNEVTLYSYKGDKDVDIFKFYGVNNNFNVIRTNRIFRNGMQPIYHLMKVIKNFNDKDTCSPEIIYSRDLLTLYFLRNKGIPFAFEAHSFATNRISMYLEKNLFKSKNFKFLGVISKALEKEYLRKYPKLLKGKIVVVPDGADLPANINENCYEKNNINMKINHDRPQIGYVGHLYKGRGIDIVIEVSKKVKECDFHIIGGEEKDIQYWSELVDNQENIHFHGFVPNSELINYYNKLDILLAPYQTKVMIGSGSTDTSKWMSPMKIFEYMAHKKCIISSDIEVLKEVLVNRHNSILVDPTAIDEWVNAIKEVIKDSDLYNKLATNAYNDLVLKYTWSKRAKTILEHFKNN